MGSHGLAADHVARNGEGIEDDEIAELLVSALHGKKTLAEVDLFGQRIKNSVALGERFTQDPLRMDYIRTEWKKKRAEFNA